jgi:hypothetical protein
VFRGSQGPGKGRIETLFTIHARPSAKQKEAVDQAKASNIARHELNWCCNDASDREWHVIGGGGLNRGNDRLKMANICGLPTGHEDRTQLSS